MTYPVGPKFSLLTFFKEVLPNKIDWEKIPGGRKIYEIACRIFRVTPFPESKSKDLKAREDSLSSNKKDCSKSLEEASFTGIESEDEISTDIESEEETKNEFYPYALPEPKQYQESFLSRKTRTQEPKAEHSDQPASQKIGKELHQIYLDNYSPAEKMITCLGKLETSEDKQAAIKYFINNQMKKMNKIATIMPLATIPQLMEDIKEKESINKQETPIFDLFEKVIKDASKDHKR